MELFQAEPISLCSEQQEFDLLASFFNLGILPGIFCSAEHFSPGTLFEGVNYFHFVLCIYFPLSLGLRAFQQANS